MSNAWKAQQFTLTLSPAVKRAYKKEKKNNHEFAARLQVLSHFTDFSECQAAVGGRVKNQTSIVN